MSAQQHAATIREALSDSVHDWDAHAALDALVAQADDLDRLLAIINNLEAERDRLQKILDTERGTAADLARQSVRLQDALRDGERIASQYLDTGRGDLDGWVDRARAALAGDH